ncbi:unnamed protein product [Dimorphilus gyrociliatus]|uniref:GPN-loop GTPase 2 n=1 Tax=Dimorphilus gyrociliatus TaxID=2664684 RepID=A0A7I8W6Q0_9ANNE|nr:unnamed protein product [Dimorphilus gyrociliatus]
MIFGQVIIGPPGSGKTTYCKAIFDLLEALGRKVAIVNLDPANELLPYTCSVNINELIKLEEVMERLKLGPNGGLLYCMEYLDKNSKWLLNKIEELKDKYLIFDCPGQVELYTHLPAIKNVITLLSKNIRLAAVNLIDSHHCSEPGKFISALCMSLSSMLHFELPHINVLSKADLAKKANLSFRLDFYADVLDLSYLLEQAEEAESFKKYNKLNKVLAGIVEDYSLVSFIPLDVTMKESCLRVVRGVDKANGYIFGAEEESNIQTMLSCAVKAEWQDDLYGMIQERYLDERTSDNDEFDDNI